MYFVCVQPWWQARQADAACSDDTTFTPLMGFYMSFPETAATCWLETANIDPSHCWVSLLDDGCDMTCVGLSGINHGVLSCHEIDARQEHSMLVFWRNQSPTIAFILFLTLLIAAIWVNF